MPLVRSYAEQTFKLVWEGHVPDDVPEDERWLWIKRHVDGGEYEAKLETCDWHWGTDVTVLEEEAAA